MFTLPDPTTADAGNDAPLRRAAPRPEARLSQEHHATPQPPQGAAYRWLWCTPIHISPHDSQVLYTGGQHLLRSTDRGDHWVEISPDLEHESRGQDPPGVRRQRPRRHPWFTISSISESPVTAGVICTSDGKVHVTRDTGKTWSDITAKLAALGGARMRMSVAFGRRITCPGAYIAKAATSSTTSGRSSSAPTTSVPPDVDRRWSPQPINVVFEDHRTPTSCSWGTTRVFVSMNGGGRWVKMNNNMPNVPVHDLLVHPRDNDLVVGSHGRGLFITNINALQQLSDTVLTADAHLFAVRPTVQHRPRVRRQRLPVRPA